MKPNFFDASDDNASSADYVNGFNTETGDPGNWGDEIGGYAGEETEGGQKKPSIWIDAADWDEAAIPRRPWVAPGYALRGAVTLVAGPPSAMKSSVMLAWAVSLALGRDFGGFRPVAAERVLVYNVEDDRNEQRRRLSATLRHFGANPADIRDKVYRVGPSAIGTLIRRDDKGKLQLTDAAEQLEELISAARPAVLIVDPLAELHEIEENDNTGLRAVIARFRDMAIRHNMAVIILHHTRKGAGQAAGDPDAARGASSIIGAVRVAVTLTGMSEDDAKAFGLPTAPEIRSAFVRMDDAKSNYAPLKGAQWFEKHAFELGNGDFVAAAVPWTPPSAKVASLSDLVALATAIEKGSPGGEPWSGKLSKDGRSVRALFEQHGFTGAAAQKQTLLKLEEEHGVKTAQYKRSDNYATAGGLHIAHKPAANWIEDDGC